MPPIIGISGSYGGLNIDNRCHQSRLIAECLPELQQLARRTTPLALPVIGASPGSEFVLSQRRREDPANPQLMF